MHEVILVTGAVGNTGKAVVKKLLARKKKVRAMVRLQDLRSQALQDLGAEIFVGDMENLAHLRMAMRDVTTCYFVFPLLPSIVRASVAVAQAAKEAGLELVVNMSQLPADSSAQSPASVNHWLAEQAFNWSGVPCCHIRATFFMEWLLWVAPLVKQTNKVIMPWEPNSLYSPVAAEDIASAISEILINPTAHRDKTYPLVGPQLISYNELAEKLTKELGRKVSYERIDADQFAQQAGQGAYFTEHIRSTANSLASGFFKVQNNLIEDITGSAPRTFDDFIKQHHAAFTEV